MAPRARGLDPRRVVRATVAAVALVAVALTVSTFAAIVMLVIQLIYQQLENYVIYPVVYRKAVELTGFTTIVAVLIFGSLLGVVGAILAVPSPRWSRRSAARRAAPAASAWPPCARAAPAAPPRGDDEAAVTQT